jgi:copper chaperone CopZ
MLTLTVKGMKCGGCVAKATEAVSRLPGYEGAEFDLQTGIGVIRGEVEPQAAVDALTRAGYPATVRSG